MKKLLIFMLMVPGIVGNAQVKKNQCPLVGVGQKNDTTPTLKVNPVADNKKSVQIVGTVLSDENKPIQAEVTIEDSEGNELKKIQTNSAGKYNFRVSLSLKSIYNLIIFKDNYSINYQVINVDSLEKTDYKINNLKVILPKLKDGKKVTFGAINFYIGEARLLPESYSSVSALCKLMQKNKKMKIRIEGHVGRLMRPFIIRSKGYPVTTFVPPPDDGLSEERARTIYDVLLSKGIEKERISIIGFDGKYPIFPYPLDLKCTEEEQKANDRVEINVISIE